MRMPLLEMDESFGSIFYPILDMEINESRLNVGVPTHILSLLKICPTLDTQGNCRMPERMGGKSLIVQANPTQYLLDGSANALGGKCAPIISI